MPASARSTFVIFTRNLSGYSFKSNEYGLAIDNVVAYEIVLPNGTASTVTVDDEDLWFALRVSGNDSSHRFLLDLPCRAVGIASWVARGPSYWEARLNVFLFREL